MDWETGRGEKKEEERTRNLFVKYERIRNLFFFLNYSKTVIIIKLSLYQLACLLKAVISITVVVNFVKITIMPPLLFLQRVTFNRGKCDVVKWHYCSSDLAALFLFHS